MKLRKPTVHNCYATRLCWITKKVFLRQRLDYSSSQSSLKQSASILSSSSVFLLSLCSSNFVFETQYDKDSFALFHCFNSFSHLDFLLFHVLLRFSLGIESLFMMFFLRISTTVSTGFWRGMDSPKPPTCLAAWAEIRSVSLNCTASLWSCSILLISLAHKLLY